MMSLADKKASIVSRRGTSLNPLQQKLAEDIWSLVNVFFQSNVLYIRMEKEVHVPLTLNHSGKYMVLTSKYKTQIKLMIYKL